jgi:hypothetical protein
MRSPPTPAISTCRLPLTGSNSIRADYDGVVGPVIDWLDSRSDIDTSRIGIWGISLGGLADSEPRQMSTACSLRQSPTRHLSSFSGLTLPTWVAAQARRSVYTPDPFTVS